MKVLYVSGAAFEHITAMPICRVSLAFLSAKDMCKLNAAGILFHEFPGFVSFHYSTIPFV